MKSTFELLTDDKAELAVLDVKSKLAMAATSMIRSKGLTQGGAAEICGVSQARISNIMNGRLSKLSSDYLVAIIVNLGGVIDSTVEGGDSGISSVSLMVGVE